MLFNKLKNLFKSREKIERAIPKIKLKKDNIRNCEIVLDREELLSKIPKNSIIAEIGVDEGDFSSKILNKAQPKLLCLIDMWGTNRYGEVKAELVNSKFINEIEKNIIKIYRLDSINATDLFDNEFFDWIYIDTDHSYETTYKELNSWSSKIKQDGVIAGHDYMMGNWLKTQRYGVVEAVHQFCIENNWQIIYLTADQTENLSFAIKRI